MSRARIALPVAALLLLCATLVQAALLRGEDERIELWPDVAMLADPSGALTVGDALAAHDRFGTPPGAYATLGLGSGAAWLRVPVTVAAGGDGDWILEADYALLQRVNLYVVRGGRVARHVELGSAQPYARRPIAGRAHATPLDLAAGDSVELLLRVQTPGARIVPLTLSRLSAFHAHELREQLIQGGLGCLALFLLLYSLAQWLTMRENLYLKYALLVLCSATFSLNFFGIGEMYLWRDLDWPERHMAGITALMAAAATALFVADALAGDLHRGLRLGLQGVAALHVAATLGHAADLVDLQTVALLMSTTGLAPALMGLPGAIAKARRGDSVGWWFMAAWLGYFVASAILVGVVRGRIDATAWTLHSFQLGATLDMLIFMRIALLQTAARLTERQRLRESFSGYVGPVVLEEIVSGRLSPDTLGEQRYVCVMFSDIRGYTARGESMHPAELLAFLNRYLDGVVGIVHRHGGTVICFLGDGIMVVFGAPQRLDNPCEAAFRAARELLDNLGHVNRRLQAQGLAPLDIGIGLHAGEAVIGHIGSRQRHEYAAIGDVTNVAARLEGATKDAGYRLLLSEEVASRLASREGLVDLGPMRLKGHTPVEAHGFGAAAASLPLGAPA